MSRSPELAAAVLAVLFTASIPVASAEDDRQAVARLRGEIEAVVAAHSQCHNVVHCRVLAMGFDACGNPTHHVAFNNSTAIRTSLESMAAEITFLEEEAWRGKPKPAQCRPAPAPAAACHRNRCTTGVDHDY